MYNCLGFRNQVTMRLNQLLSLIKEYFILAAFGAAILSIILYFGYSLIYKKKMKGKKSLTPRQIIFGIMILGYLLMVLSVTFLSRGSNYPSSVNLNLFSSYREAWNTFTLRNWQFVILNIVMFIPLGVLLPLLNKKFLSPVRTIGAGLLLTLSIEIFQLILKLGIFEIDDIFNNVLGTIIGYSLFMCIYTLAKGQTRKFPKYILILLLVGAVFGGIFIKYDKQEYGNLYFDYVYKFNLKNTRVESKVEFNEDEVIVPVYYTKTYTPIEAEEFAREFFENIGVSASNMDVNLMSEDILFRNSGYHLWLSGNTGTYNYTDFSSFDEGMKPMNLPQEELMEKVNEFGINIPPEADFTNEKEGNYSWKVNKLMVDEKMIDGYVTCTVYNDDSIKKIENNLKTWDKYKEVKIISEKEAYERLLDGKFNIWIPDNKINSLEIKDVYLDYKADTKNFYQPVYVFNAIVNGENYGIRIPAMK